MSTDFTLLIIYIPIWGYIMKRVRVKLDKYLPAHNITRYELARRSGIKFQTIDGYYKNTVVRYDAVNLGKIAEALDCGIEDILELVDEP